MFDYVPEMLYVDGTYIFNIQTPLPLPTGAGMFVTTVVVGTISVVKPFKATERPFLRDVIFYMGTVYWVFYVLYREKMYLFDTIGKHYSKHLV